MTASQFRFTSTVSGSRRSRRFDFSVRELFMSRDGGMLTRLC